MPKCKHNKIKYYCKDCKGNGICQHNIRKYYCKDCKGNGICQHNKIKYYCKDCKNANKKEYIDLIIIDGKLVEN